MGFIKNIKFTTFPKVEFYKKYNIFLKKKNSPFKQIVHFVVPKSVKNSNLNKIFKNIVEQKEQKNCAIYIEIAQKPNSFIKFTFNDVYLDASVLIYCHSAAYIMYLKRNDFNTILANKKTNVSVYLK